MAYQIPSYRATREMGSVPSAPGGRAPQVESGLGEAIQGLAGTAQAIYEKVTRESAETESLAAASKTQMELEEAFRNDQTTAKPGADQFTPTFMGKVDAVINKTAEGLTNDAARKRYRDRMLNVATSMQSRALGYEVQERIAKRTSDFKTASENNANSVYTVDGVARDLTYRNLQADLESSLDAIELPPSTKQQLREESRLKMATSAIQADLRDRPENVQDWLVGKGGGYYGKLKQSESGGRNIKASTSSAFGPYQFTKGTWSALITKHPDLGLTEADRFNPLKQEIGIRAFTDDNAKVLKGAGVPVNDTTLKIAHFLGVGGATQFLRANPNSPAREHVAPASVAANASIFRPGRTVGEVINLFAKQMGGEQVTYDKDVGVPAYYADIPAQRRDVMYSQAETEMNKRNVTSTAAFQQRVQNSVAEFTQHGAASSPPSEQEFVAAFGVQKGTIAYGEFQATAQAAQASYKLQDMPLTEQGDFIESLKPQQGDPFYAEKLKGYTQARETAALMRKQMTEDFGQFVANRSAVAGELLARAFSSEVSQDEAFAAADQFAQVSEAEANRLGIPSNARNLLPKAYINTITSGINEKLSSDADARVKVAALRNMAERWGDNWPRVYNEMRDNMSAPVQVITSGIRDKAAMVLAAVHDKSFDELTNLTMDKVAKSELETSLKESFAPFITSTMWQNSSLPGVNIFYEQAKKLAAVYKSQGQDPTEAAQTAYNDIIGFKYKMIDTRGVNVRLPIADNKGQPSALDNPHIERFLSSDRVNILRSDRIVARPEELKRDAEATDRLRYRLERDTSWVTLPDNSGVGMLYQGQLIRDAKGQPIVRRWDEIAQGTAEMREREKADPYGTMPNQGEPVQ
jgi:hypothetical protein